MVSAKTAAEFRLFLQMALWGWGMGMVYDGLRIGRNTIRHSQRWVDREDLVFWLCAGFLFFDYLVRHGEGQLRLSEILGAGLGAALYQYTVSPFLVKTGSYLLGFLKKGVKLLVFPVCRCIKWLKNHLKRGNIFLNEYFGHSAKRKRNGGEQRKNGESRI